jgi:hypothetical protein
MFEVIAIWSLLFILGVALIWFSSPRVRPITAFVILQLATAALVFALASEIILVLAVCAATSSVTVPLLLKRDGGGSETKTNKSNKPSHHTA